MVLAVRKLYDSRQPEIPAKTRIKTNVTKRVSSTYCYFRGTYLFDCKPSYLYFIGNN
jgi:hypothetical protein